MRFGSLSVKQRRILSHAAGSQPASIKEIAAKAQSSEHTVRHFLENARREKWLRPSIFINHSALGLQTFNVFFSCPRERASAVIDFLKGDSRVVWATENVGYPRYQLTAVCRKASAMTTMFGDISRACGTPLTDRSWALETALYYWGTRLTPDDLPARSFCIEQQEAATFDVIDLKILDALRTADCSHMTTLARAVKEPASTVSYRLNRLQSRGVISPIFDRLDAARAGLVCCEYLLTLSRFTPTLDQSIRAFCAKCPEVTLLIPSFGMWDYKIEATGESLEQLDDVRDRLEAALPNAFSSVTAVFRKGLLSERTHFQKHGDLKGT